MTEEPTVTVDPAILVYAARHVLEHGGPHPHMSVAVTIRDNATRIPAAARRQLEREIVVWLNGRGATSTPVERAPWRKTLDVLCGLKPPPPRRAPEAGRRALDVPAARGAA